jgi:hypothetical protein
LLHEWVIWRSKLDGLGGLCSPDLGCPPCRSSPMPLAVTIFPSSDTE